MRKLFLAALIASLCASVDLSQAGQKFDGSAPLLCVPIEITECEAAGKCYQGTAEDVNLPQFIRVNLKDKVLTGVGHDSGRTTSIDFMERENGKIVMHGRQRGRGWTAVISDDSGKLVATIADDSTAFIIFGACTAP